MPKQSLRLLLRLVFAVSFIGFLFLNVNLLMNKDRWTSTSGGGGSSNGHHSVVRFLYQGSEAQQQVSYSLEGPVVFVEAKGSSGRNITKGNSSGSISSSNSSTSNRSIAAPPPNIDITWIGQSRFQETIRSRYHSSAQARNDSSIDAGSFQVNAEDFSNLTLLRRFVMESNRRQRIANLDRFDMPLSREALVIVVQVHDRLEYLRHLIDSLRRARHIEQTLLIFSHDYVSEQINRLIATIDFCVVMQIFYELSMQLNPDRFPGKDPNDCPRDMKHEEAIVKKCNNAEHPDKYGHYREARYSQTKHHWFWKLSYVFDRLDVTRNFEGSMLLLEEDHYVTEDFIYMLRKMYKFGELACNDCHIYTLGNYDKVPVYGDQASKVELTYWVASKHNMGMSFRRNIWNELKRCSETFCSFDDYNWDWSLQYVGSICIAGKLKVMAVKSPRTYHIGECGVHHKHANCNPEAQVHAIKERLSQNHGSLFPPSLFVASTILGTYRIPKPNGGWGDIRDHQLCRNFTGN